MMVFESARTSEDVICAYYSRFWCIRRQVMKNIMKNQCFFDDFNDFSLILPLYLYEILKVVFQLKFEWKSLSFFRGRRI